jgi:hypothetical protein
MRIHAGGVACCVLLMRAGRASRVRAAAAHRPGRRRGERGAGGEANLVLPDLESGDVAATTAGRC